MAESKTLEKEIKRDVKPIIDEAMQKFLGVSIDELSKDITEKLQKNPLLDIEVNTALDFKKAKKKFKKDYLKKLLQINYGNVSEVAKIADVDRRSIHRIVKETQMDVSKIRREMTKAYNIKHDMVNAMIESTLDHYKGILHPDKLNKMYKSVPELSKDILEELPDEPMKLKNAEELFEKEFVSLRLHD